MFEFMTVEELTARVWKGHQKTAAQDELHSLMFVWNHSYSAQKVGSHETFMKSACQPILFLLASRTRSETTALCDLYYDLHTALPPFFNLRKHVSLQVKRRWRCVFRGACTSRQEIRRKSDYIYIHIYIL